MKPLDLTKPIQTRDGRPAKFLHKLKGEPDFPIVCVIDSSEDEQINYYNKDGLVRTGGSVLDLINVPVKHVREYWVNGYEHSCSFYNTREGCEIADADNPSKRLACVKITIPFEEGQGL